MFGCLLAQNELKKQQSLITIILCATLTFSESKYKDQLIRLSLAIWVYTMMGS